MAIVDQAGASPSHGGVEVPGVRGFLLPALWDTGLPTAAYYLARAAGETPSLALLAATAIAGARVVFVASRSRCLDAIAAFLLVVFGVGLALSFSTGHARFLLAKDSVPTAVAGLIFIGSCTFGRPLAYAWAKRLMARTPELRTRWDALWSSQAAFRRACYLVSLIWGVGLLVEAGVRLLLIYLIPVDSMAGLSSALSLGTIAVLAMWTVWYTRWVQR